jgi:hypothetical protein
MTVPEVDAGILTSVRHPEMFWFGELDRGNSMSYVLLLGGRV